MAYTLEWVASEVGVSKRTLRWWMKRSKGFLVGPGKQCSAPCDRYSPEFVRRAKLIRGYLDLWPQGPFENIIDRIQRGELP